jgi:phospholipid/cholesterol/gamma-HCH transport system substrate-binding protein
MQRRTEIQVGITVLMALVILVGGVTWLKEFTLQRSVKVWTVVFPQTGGLGASDEVQVNGIRKGAVQSMNLVGDLVLVKLALAEDVVLTTDSRVAIRNVGLMGEKVIAVDLRSTGIAYSERDTIIGIYESGVQEVMADLGGAMNAVSNLSTQLSAIAENLAGQGDFAGTMHNIKGTSDELRLTVEENRRLINTTLESMAASSQTVRRLTVDREEKLSEAIDHFASSLERMDRLAARLDSLSGSLNSVSRKLDSGQGTLGKLVNEDSLHTDLKASVAALRSLIEDIRENPKDYFRFSIF